MCVATGKIDTGLLSWHEMWGKIDTILGEACLLYTPISDGEAVKMPLLLCLDTVAGALPHTIKQMVNWRIVYYRIAFLLHWCACASLCKPTGSHWQGFGLISCWRCVTCQLLRWMRCMSCKTYSLPQHGRAPLPVRATCRVRQSSTINCAGMQ